MLHMVIYGMALDITEDEWNAIMPIVRPAVVGMALANDYFSWQKEYDQFKREPKAALTNGIWVLMHEHSIIEEEAKQMLKGTIADYSQEYVHLMTGYLHSTKGSQDVRKFLSAVEIMIPGNIGWSQFSPRYGFVKDTSTNSTKAVDGSQRSPCSTPYVLSVQHSTFEDDTVNNTPASTHADTSSLPSLTAEASGRCKHQGPGLISSRAAVEMLSPFPQCSAWLDKMTSSSPREREANGAAILTRHSLPSPDDEASHPSLEQLTM